MPPKPTAAALPAARAEAPFAVSHRTLLVLTALAAGAYFLYSFASDGFYQHDEAGHFLNMLAFWDDPRAILGNWAKFGYKLLYVGPALGGPQAVKALNCLLAAGSGYLAARAVELRGHRTALAAFVLALTQPLWANMAFRNYSEIPTAFLLVLAYYLHVRQRPALAALAVGWVCTIRQEFFPFLGLYGADLLWRRQWRAVLAGAALPLLQNLYGAYFAGGDGLYLLHQIGGTSGTLQGNYPRQGFDHYFRTSMVVFGPVAVALLVHYLGWSALRRRLPDLYLTVPLVGFFLLHCLFNWKGVVVGPSTGGNLRYLLVVAPLVAVAGAYGLSATLGERTRGRAALWLVPLLAVTVLYLNHQNNLIGLVEAPDARPGVGVLLAGAAVLLASGQGARRLNYAVAAVAGFLAVMSVKPFKLSQEDQAVQDLARWFRRNEAQFAGRPVYVNHIMFFYWLGRPRAQFRPLDQTTAATAPAGSLCIWDTHYSFRPRHNPRAASYDYFAQQPAAYRFEEQFTTPAQNFGVFLFEKTAAPPGVALTTAGAAPAQPVR